MGVPRNTSSHYVHVYCVDSSRNYSDVFQLMRSVPQSQSAMGCPETHLHTTYMDILCRVQASKGTSKRSVCDRYQYVCIIQLVTVGIRGTNQ